jgi:hypothetical protein
MKPASVSRRLAVKAGAKRRRADEYGAAQERGEFKWNGGERGNQFAVLPPQQMSASPAKKSTKPASYAMPRTTIPASSVLVACADMGTGGRQRHWCWRHKSGALEWRSQPSAPLARLGPFLHAKKLRAPHPVDKLVRQAR